MGLLDKVKDQAKDIKGKVGDKVEDVQAKHKADGLLGELGRSVYAERTGRAIEGAPAEVDRIVAELKKLEDEGVKIIAAQ